MDKFNCVPDAHGEYDLAGADPDVWSLLFALKALLGVSFRLTWQRSHAEKRKCKAAYHRHNWGNDWSDVMADRAMANLHAGQDRPFLGSAR